MYSITELAKLSGVTTRTLRYYETLGLIKANRDETSGYRQFDNAAVDKLQQILILRAMAMPLKEIASIIETPDDAVTQLKAHLNALRAEELRLKRLITTVEKTIASKERGLTMSDQEKFEGLKAEKLAENEVQYGTEIRERYGEATVEAANAKFMAMSPETAAKAEQLSVQIEQLIAKGLDAGDPDGNIAVALAETHREWLKIYWPHYTAEAHRNLSEMYLADERFKAFYDRIGNGGAAFLVNAIKVNIMA